MSLGYGPGSIFLSPKRDRILVSLSLAMIATFFLLRTTHGYGDPHPWAAANGSGMATAMVFFNLQKYPPALLYVCATLGPILLLIPFLDRLQGPIAEFFRTFGSVPLTAYVAHLYAMHLLPKCLRERASPYR